MSPRTAERKRERYFSGFISCWDNSGGGGENYHLPDIAVRFIHYHTFKEAKTKWEERFARINYDNLFIVMDKGMYVAEDVLDRFTSLLYNNKICFTERSDFKRWPYIFNISYYTEKLYTVGNVYNTFNVGLAQYRWLDEFDYVTWLNSGKTQADVFIKDYINTHFIKK